VDSEVQGDDDPGHCGVADELGVAEHGGSAMVVAVEEGCRAGAVSSGRETQLRFDNDLLRGFFLRNMKTVSKSSRYLVR
jgi:hypothetical protein